MYVYCVRWARWRGDSPCLFPQEHNNPQIYDEPSAGKVILCADYQTVPCCVVFML